MMCSRGLWTKDMTCWMIQRKQHSDGVCIGREIHIMIPALDSSSDMFRGQEL